MNRTHKAKLLSLCLVGALILPSSAAFADDAADAATYYQQASEAYQSEDYARADELLARAYDKDPDLIYQYNRVLANQAMGDIDAALGILDTYQEQMAADPDARFSDIPAIRANLEQAQAEAQAKREAAQAEAEAIEKEDALAVTPPPTVVEDGASSSQILGWSLVGVGAAGLGAAALFGSKVLISDVDGRFDCLNELNNNTSWGNCYDEFGEDDASKQKQFELDNDAWDTHNTLTWVSLSVGAAALIGGGVVLYLDAQDDAEGAPDMSASSGPKLEWTPYVSADGAGSTFNLTF